MSRYVLYKPNITHNYFHHLLQCWWHKANISFDNSVHMINPASKATVESPMKMKHHYVEVRTNRNHKRAFRFEIHFGVSEFSNIQKYSPIIGWPMFLTSYRLNSRRAKLIRLDWVCSSLSCVANKAKWSWDGGLMGNKFKWRAIHIHTKDSMLKLKDRVKGYNKTVNTQRKYWNKTQ